MSRRQAKVLALLSAAAILLALLLSSRLWVRLDLTRNKAYTISEVSRRLYREIDDQVTITYFVSDRLALAHPMPGEIADLLKEYAAYSRGKIRFIQRDPAKAELLQKVENLGIIPQQIQVVEKNETTLATVYTGILLEYLNRESVIPVVFSLDTLEYDLSSRIRSLLTNRERELGVIVGDANKQWVSEYGLLNRELALAGFNVRQLSPGEEIPALLPALFVLGGAGDLDVQALYAIDSYIQNGGNVFFAVDSISVNTQGSLEARPVEDKGLLAMLANYGIAVRRAMILDVTALGLSFQTQSGFGTMVRTVRYPLWIGVQENSGNRNHPLSSRFRGLDLYWASPLELSPPPGVQAEALFTSTDEAWLETENFNTNPNMISGFMDEREATSGAKILGASLMGAFPSAFERDALPGKDAGKTSRIIVVGDTDFAGTLMQANRGEERNLDFLLRAAEWLSSDDDLIAIRSREDVGRLDRLTDRDKRDAAMGFSRLFNMVLVPLGVTAAGLIIVGRRKRRTANERGQPVDL